MQYVVPTSFRWLVLGLALIAAVVFGYVEGVQHEQSKQLELNLKQNQAVLNSTQAARNVEHKLALGVNASQVQYQKGSQSESTQYQNAASRLAASLKHKRVHNSTGAGTAGTTQATTDSSGIADESKAQFLEESGADLLQIGKDADEVVLKLNLCVDVLEKERTLLDEFYAQSK